MKQSDVAKILGTYQASICRMRQGRFLPTIEEIVRGANYLQLDLKEIQENIEEIRIGNLTVIKEDFNDLLAILFDLKRENLCA